MSSARGLELYLPVVITLIPASDYMEIWNPLKIFIKNNGMEKGCGFNLEHFRILMAIPYTRMCLSL